MERYLPGRAPRSKKSSLDAARAQGYISSMGDPWDAILDRLRLFVSDDIFSLWFAPTRTIGYACDGEHTYEGRAVIVQVRSQRHERILAAYAPLIQRIKQEVGIPNPIEYYIEP
ncbi:MAG: hypothetical protein ACRD3Q_06820 [Terriglobales bacterium]